MKQSSNPPTIQLKIIIDTNLYLSLFVFSSSMLHHIFQQIANEKLILYISSAQIKEINKKFVFFKVTPHAQQKAMFFINSKSTLINPKITINKARDINDNFLLELSESAQADYLITRDKDLLTLKQWKHTDILMPEDFLPLLRKLGLLE